jgi:hypothetical protein
MGGFPARTNRDGFGPTYENERPVRNSKRELGQNVVNLTMWNLAGLTQTGPKVVITADVGLVTAYTGTHTGADNQATLTDSTKSWTVDELVGKTINNTTDGSTATITANTATTVTATLGGGAENDWDTGDAYTITSTEAVVDYQGLAWDPEQAVTNIVFTRVQAGYYSFAFATTYEDELGNAQPTALEAGLVIASKGQPYSGTHTGALNQATLTDSTKSWVVNELVGKWIYNITDGSKVIITANTATTVTGVLAGGTDNDWDTDDAYVIIDEALIGIVNMGTTIAGNVFFFDTSNDFAEPTAFLMVLW